MLIIKIREMTSPQLKHDYSLTKNSLWNLKPSLNVSSDLTLSTRYILGILLDTMT